MLLTSRDNPNLKLIRSLSQRSGRKKANAFLAEGKRLVEEAAAYAADQIRFFAVSESFADKEENFMKMLDETGKNGYTVKDNLFRGLCDTETPQGVLAVLDLPSGQKPDLSRAEYLLVLDGVAEPGNMGTIIRTAEAAGVDAVCLYGGCVDVYNPKTVRASMGSLFRMPILQTELSDLRRLQAEGVKFCAAALDGSEQAMREEFSGRRAVIIGNEAHGVSAPVLKFADIRVKIPMSGRVESLNAAVAAGILMYTFRVKRDGNEPG